MAVAERDSDRVGPPWAIAGVWPGLDIDVLWSWRELAGRAVAARVKLGAAWPVQEAQPVGAVVV
jgi:hypothetical protein